MSKSRTWFVAGAIILLTAPAAMAQDTPRDLQDLVGERASYGEQDLESRGYTHIKTEKGDDRTWSNWWNGGSRTCLDVVTRDGVFDSIVTAPPADCNQRVTSDDGNGGNTAAAVGVAAAAIIGAALLAHNSHHHENGKHYDDPKEDAQYERGFRDGLYNETYHNYDNSDAYARGYEAGVEQHGHETSHRDHHDRHRAGYQRSVSVADLEGARASSAESEMESRGFRNVDGEKVGTTAYTYWYNRDTGQCLQMTVGDGQVVDISNIGSHPACR